MRSTAASSAPSFRWPSGLECVTGVTRCSDSMPALIASWVCFVFLLRLLLLFIYLLERRFWLFLFRFFCGLGSCNTEQQYAKTMPCGVPFACQTTTISPVHNVWWDNLPNQCRLRTEHAGQRVFAGFDC